MAVILAVVASGCGAAAVSPSPRPIPAATPTPTPTPEPLITPAATVALDDGPDYSDLEAPTSGVLYPWYEANIAYRHPIAVMIDDAWGARPQAGLSQADIVYQAPAEGGVPRYMLLFQTSLPESIGPVRSTRLYYVAWAEEWKAMYVHMLGAPNAIARLAQIDKKDIYDANVIKWGRYMRRVPFKVGPHNLYTTGANMLALAAKVGATAPVSKSPFVFMNDLPRAKRGPGGTLVVPYSGNKVVYHYDQVTNTYPRAVTGQNPQRDENNQQPIAPRNVVVLFQKTGYLEVLPGQANKGRLELTFLGTGKASVYNNGLAIDAIWSKATESSPTLLTYASGPNKGRPVPMVRGQTFIQVVPTTTNVTWTPASGSSQQPVPFAVE